MSVPSASYKRHRFPREMIAHAVWLYFRFPLSFRLIEEMLLEPEIRLRICPQAASQGSQSGGISRHLDEVRSVIRGQPHWLWRAVDQDGYVLDEILQTRRNTKAARRLLTRLLKQGARPRRMSTDKLKSYGAARRKLGLGIRHLTHKGLNNRAENSHLPLRKRERVMQKFRSPGGCQRFVCVFSAVRNLFVPPASLNNALSRHTYRLRTFAQWNTATAITP